MPRVKNSLANLTCSEEKIVLEYRVMDRTDVELPCDHSGKAFFTTLRGLEGVYEPNQGKTAIYQMKLSEGAGRDKSGNMYDHIYNSPTRDRAESRTKPHTIYTESTELLTALMKAYAEDTVAGKKLGPEKQAERTLEILAQELSEKSSDDLANDRQSRVIANDPEVRRIMLSHFDEDLKKRLSTIWDLLHDNETFSGDLVTTVKRLDGIILDFKDAHADKEQPENDTPREPEAGSVSGEAWRRKLNRLYFDLLGKRISLIHPNGTDTSEVNLRFELPNTPENKTLLEEMHRILDSYTRSTGPEERARFGVLYQEYMDRCFPEGLSDQTAKTFVEDYQRLKDYLREETAEAVFMEDVRRTFRWNINRMFRFNVGEKEKWKYTFDPNFSHVQDMFAYTRIMAFCQNLETDFHQVFACLRDVAIVEQQWEAVSDVYVSQSEWVRMSNLDNLDSILKAYYQKLIYELRYWRAWLARNYPDIPHLLSREPIESKSFAQAYSEYCSDFFPNNDLNCESVSLWVRMGVGGAFANEPVVCGENGVISAERNMLLATFQIVVMALVEQEMTRIREEYIEMRST